MAKVWVVVLPMWGSDGAVVLGVFASETGAEAFVEGEARDLGARVDAWDVQP